MDEYMNVVCCISPASVPCPRVFQLNEEGHEGQPHPTIPPSHLVSPRRYQLTKQEPAFIIRLPGSKKLPHERGNRSSMLTKHLLRNGQLMTAVETR